MPRMLSSLHDIISFDKRFAVNKNSEIVNLESSDKILVNSPKKVIEISADKIMVLDDLNRGYILENSSFKEIYSHQFRIDGYSPNYLLFYKYGSDRTNGVYSFTKKEVLFDTKDYLGRHIFQDHVFGELNGNVFCRRIIDGIKRWEITLENFGAYKINGRVQDVDLQKFIGVYNNVLYVKAGNKLIIGFNIKDGSETFNYRYEEGHIVLDNLELDVEEGLIFSIGPRHYFELNLSSGKSKLYDLSTEVDRSGVETTRLGSWEGDYISFWEGSTNNRFGIFKRSKKTIIWQHEIVEAKDKFPAIRQVKHHENRIYVHDHNLTLHIFEREV